MVQSPSCIRDMDVLIRSIWMTNIDKDSLLYIYEKKRFCVKSLLIMGLSKVLR